MKYNFIYITDPDTYLRMTQRGYQLLTSKTVLSEDNVGENQYIEMWVFANDDKLVFDKNDKYKLGNELSF